MSLATGEKIHRRSWTETPISDMTISRVHALAIRERQPPIQNSNLVIEWRPGQSVDEDEYDADCVPQNPENDDDDDEYDPEDYEGENDDD